MEGNPTPIIVEPDHGSRHNELVTLEGGSSRGRRRSLFDSSLVRNACSVKSAQKATLNQLKEDEDEEEEDEEEEKEGTEDDDIQSQHSSISEPDLSKSDEDGIAISNGIDAKKMKKETQSEALEDQLTNEKLRQLEEIFSEADEDGGGGLDMEEFRHAMRTQLGDITDAELDKIFMKVDTNCDGTVDWDEYLTYMLLECKGQDTMSIQARQPFPKYVSTVKSPHRDSVIRILFITSYGRYMSFGQEGIVCVWNTCMNLLATHRVQPEGRSVWVTDAAYLCGVNSVAISTTSRELYLYDISASRFQLNRRITNLNSCALTVHFWNNSGTHKFQLTNGRSVKAILMWGESNGSLSTIFFHTEPYLSPLCGKYEQKNNRKRIAFQEFLLDRIPGMSGTYREHLHKDLIRQVMFCPHLCSTISSCTDTETAMFMGGIGLKLTNSYFKVKKGIETFDYAPSMNVIVTGGYDGLVRIWNPYVPAKPVIRLDGHQFPILHLRIDTTLENVVSISEIKEIRVHDLSTQTCIQTIYKKMIHGLGPRPVTAFFLNQSRKNIIFATNTLATLEQKEEERLPVELVSHDKPVTHALYNPLFEQMVSVGTDSMVCVWDVTTGEKVMQFKAHQLRRSGEMKDIEVTAMTFDPTYRRLITAAKNGDVRIWNFNNGACLRELPKFDNTEITSLTCPNHNIITAGWNRRVTEYVDSAEDDSVRWLKSYHLDDILSLSHYRGSILASGSYDGHILVWSLATGRLLFCLNGSRSHNQIRAARYFATEMIKDETGPMLAGSGQESSNEYSPTETNGQERKKEKSPKPSVASCESKNSIQKLLFLEGRESDADTAILLVAGSDGNIQAWSLHHQSGLLGTFPAAHTKDTFVVSMITDEENVLLVTGDSGGYVKAFDISNYCIAAWEEQEHDEVYLSERRDWYEKFPFVNWAENVFSHVGCGTKSWVRQYYQGGEHRPPLLNSYRAHLQTITSVDLVAAHGTSLIVTSSLDRSIRLWTIGGQFIGIFGQRDLWDTRLTGPSRHKEVMTEINTKGVYRHRKVLMPPDIRRVGSAATLAVLNGGRRPAWKLCSNVIKWLFRSVQPRSEGTPEVDQRKILERTSSVKTFSEASPSILGSSYTRLTRHRPLPPIPPPRFNGTTEVLSVYGSLKYHSLDEVVHPPMPDSVRAALANKRKAGQRLFLEASNIQRRMRGVRAFRGSNTLVKTIGKKWSINKTDLAAQLESSDMLSQSITKKEPSNPSQIPRAQPKGSTGSTGALDSFREEDETVKEANYDIAGPEKLSSIAEI